MRLCSLVLIVWGCAGLVPSLEAQPPDQEKSSPLRRIVVSSKKPADLTGAFIVSYGLLRDDFRRIETLDGIQHSTPVRELQHEARFGEWSRDVALIGTMPSYAELYSLTQEQGRFLTEKDVKQLNNIAVLNVQTAKSLFPDQDPIGKNVRIGPHYFLVVGTVTTANPADGNLGNRRREPPQIYIPLSTMRSRLGDLALVRERGSINGERFELSRIVLDVPGPQAERIADEIRRLLRRSHETEDFEVQISKGE